MKYTNDRIPNKCYYISRSIHGDYVMKEHRNGVFATQLRMDRDQYKNTIQLLEQNGWKESN